MFGQAQQIIRPCRGAALQLFTVGGIDADSAAFRLQPPHRLFKMRERRVGQTAEIDDVGAGPAQSARAHAQRIERQRGSVDDFREDAQIVAREIRRAAAFAEIGRKIFHLVRSALEDDAEGLGADDRDRPGSGREAPRGSPEADGAGDSSESARS